jgi:hypothetical protein
MVSIANSDPAAFQDHPIELPGPQNIALHAWEALGEDGTGIADDDRRVTFKPISWVDPRPLDAIVRQWSRSDFYDARVARPDAPVRFGATASDAHWAEELWDEGDLDWFLAKPGDKAVG